MKKTIAITLAAMVAVASFVTAVHSYGMAVENRVSASNIRSLRGEIYASKMVADEIQIKSKDGKVTLLIGSHDSGVGMWLSSGDQTLSMVADAKDNTGPFIGVISKQHIERGCQFAVCAGKDGQAYIQVTDKDGWPHMITPGEVIAALGKGK